MTLEANDIHYRRWQLVEIGWYHRRNAAFPRRLEFVRYPSLLRDEVNNTASLLQRLHRCLCEATFALSSGPNGVLDINAALRQSIVSTLERGQSRLSLRMQASSTSLFPVPNLGVHFPGSSDGYATSNIRVNLPDDGVEVDVFDATGLPLTTSATVVDMRSFKAGTYYIHARGTSAATQNVTFEILAPPEGQSTVRFGQPDRDRVSGDGGSDIVIATVIWID